jgi:hypothetical protein
MMNMLLITRVHYTIDVASGLVYAFFVYSLVERVVRYFDWLLSLPYLLGKKAFERCGRYARRMRSDGSPKSSLEDLILANDRSL